MTWNVRDQTALLEAFSESITIDFGTTQVDTIGVMDDGYQQMMIGNVEVADRMSRVTVAMSVVADLATGDCYGSGTQVIARGNTYAVTSHQPDGQGFSVLILAREES